MKCRGDDDRYLHLICFIAHQFYRLQDTLVDILLKVIQNALNSCKRIHKEEYYTARVEQRRAVQKFVTCVDSGAFSPLKTIENIAFSEELSDNEKVKRIQDLLIARAPQRNAAFEQLTAIKTKAQRDAYDADYYEVLARKVSGALTPRSNPVSSKTGWQRLSGYLPSLGLRVAS